MAQRWEGSRPRDPLRSKPRTDPIKRISISIATMQTGSRRARTRALPRVETCMVPRL
jgi:hypothetical protein